MHSLDPLEKLNNAGPSLKSLCTGPWLMLSSFSTKFLVLLQQSRLLLVNKCKDGNLKKAFQFVTRGEVAGWPRDGGLTQVLREGVQKVL